MDHVFSSSIVCHHSSREREVTEFQAKFAAAEAAVEEQRGIAEQQAAKVEELEGEKKDLLKKVLSCWPASAEFDRGALILLDGEGIVNASCRLD